MGKGLLSSTCFGGSTVIKYGKTGPILKRLSTVDLADHLGEARELVDAAKEQAARVVAVAEAERERLAIEVEEAAKNRGYEVGYAEGRSAGHVAAFEESKKTFERQHANIVKHMQQTVTQIVEMKESLRIAAERDVLAFAVKLATDLTFSIGRLSCKSAIENVKRSLRLVGLRTDLTIRVHPDDASAMETYAAAAVRHIEQTSVFAVVTDDSLSPGGCIVETDRSVVDATLETQTQELTSLLLGDMTSGGKRDPADESGKEND